MNRIALLSCVALIAAAPATSGPSRSPHAIVEDMRTAEHELSAALGGPRTLADGAKRSAAAPLALPPLRRLVADDRDLARLAGKVTPDFFEVQLRAIGAALDDRESTDALAAFAADPNVAQRGQGGQLLARWLRSTGDDAAQAKVIDDLAPLTAAHPASDDLARFTAMMADGAAAPANKGRLRDLLAHMTNPLARQLHAQLQPTTAPAK